MEYELENEFEYQTSDRNSKKQNWLDGYIYHLDCIDGIDGIVHRGHKGPSKISISYT